MANRVLIAEPSRVHRDDLALLLRAAAYEVETMGSLAPIAAAGLLRDDDVILIDAGDLAQARLIDFDDGTSLTNRAALIVMTDDPDPAIRQTALDAGAEDVMLRPVDAQMLMARLRRIACNRQVRHSLAATRAAVNLYGFSEIQSVWHQGGMLTLVTADNTRAADWSQRLASLNPRLATPAEMLRDNGEPPPGARVLLLDLTSEPGADGPAALALMSELRSRPKTRDCAILAVVAPGQDQRAAAALDLGAQDVMVTAYTATDLLPRARRLCARKRVYDAMRTPVEDSLRLAATDQVTGLFNKRYAEGALAQLVRDSHAEDVVAFMIADLDHLKRVNDTQGHSAGDAVLRKVARAIRAVLRPEDLIARIGGDEFLIVLRTCDESLAAAIAQRVCDAVAKGGAGSSAPSTISVGVAVGAVSGSQSAKDRLYQAADEALYAAKNAGRNCIHIAAPTSVAAPPRPALDTHDDGQVVGKPTVTPSPQGG